MTDDEHLNRDLDPDKETTDAINALKWRLLHKNVDDKPEYVAREFIWALRARGWRPTRAKASEAWRPTPGERPSKRVAEHAAEARRLLAEQGIFSGVQGRGQVASWCGTCGCSPDRHSSWGGCDQCGACDALIVASLSDTEADEQDGSEHVAPDQDIVGVLTHLAGAQRASMPEAPNVSDDATRDLRRSPHTWSRPVETVDLPEPEPSQIDTDGPEPPPRANPA